MKDELLALAARVEKAEGPNFRLEQEVMWAVKGVQPCHQSEFDKPPAYTASLDAALSLVPEGMVWMLTNTGIKGRGADLTCATAMVGVPDDTETDPIEAATPALALTAASLRAIAQGERQ